MGRWQHTGANIDRYKRYPSWYYDKETGLIAKASAMPSYPAERPRRYVFICQSKHITRMGLLKRLYDDHGIRIKKPKPAEDMPF